MTRVNISNACARKQIMRRLKTLSPAAKFQEPPLPSNNILIFFYSKKQCYSVVLCSSKVVLVNNTCICVG